MAFTTVLKDASYFFTVRAWQIPVSKPSLERKVLYKEVDKEVVNVDLKSCNK